MVYSYGSRHIGHWVVIGEAEVGLKVASREPSDIFEARYIVPRKTSEAYGKWQATFNLIGANKFNSGLREILAYKIGVSSDQLEILWWHYDNEAEPASLTIQVRYIPAIIAGVKALPARVALIGWFAVFGSMAVVTYLASLFAFSPDPKLDTLKYLVEQINIALRYALYITIAGGSIYLLTKFLPKLWVKKRKTTVKAK